MTITPSILRRRRDDRGGQFRASWRAAGARLVRRQVMSAAGVRDPFDARRLPPAMVLLVVILAMTVAHGELVFTLTMLGPLLVLSMLSGWVYQRMQWAKIESAALGGGRCPACLYELTGLGVEDDGCVVCPECAAAWRSTRMPMFTAADISGRSEDERCPPTAPGVAARDAHGRIVPVIDRRLAGLPAAQREAIDAATLDRIQYKLSVLGTPARFWSGVIMLFVVGAAMLLMYKELPQIPAWLMLVLFAIVAGIAGWSAWGIWRSNEGVKGDEAAAVWLGAGHCPSCGRLLSDSREPAAVDCPCGTTWLVSGVSP